MVTRLTVYVLRMYGKRSRKASGLLQEVGFMSHGKEAKRCLLHDGTLAVLYPLFRPLLIMMTGCAVEDAQLTPLAKERRPVESGRGCVASLDGVASLKGEADGSSPPGRRRHDRVMALDRACSYRRTTSASLLLSTNSLIVSTHQRVFNFARGAHQCGKQRLVLVNHQSSAPGSHLTATDDVILVVCVDRRWTARTAPNP